jgi:hypothetical protein
MCSHLMALHGAMPRALGVLVLASAADAAPPARPHIVHMLADDYGYNNVGWRNPTMQTPNIDALARGGVVLERHYVYKFCSPTRAAALSGRLPYHVNQQNPVDITSDGGVDLRMTLLPQRLRAAGYRTAAVGKWHTGGRSPANLPIRRGFDRHLGFLGGGEDHRTQVKTCCGDAACACNATDPRGNLTDLWRDRAPGRGVVQAPLGILRGENHGCNMLRGA